MEDLSVEAVLWSLFLETHTIAVIGYLMLMLTLGYRTFVVDCLETTQILTRSLHLVY
jgi:hypothetical protein